MNSGDEFGDHGQSDSRAPIAVHEEDPMSRPMAGSVLSRGAAFAPPNGSVPLPRMTGTTELGTTGLELTDLEQGFEQYRRELTAYCYRMLGSAFEADDAVQETLVRAWRGFEGFEGRSALRSWLYRIASNVCFDMLKGRKRRAMPIDVEAMGSASGPVASRTAESNWVGPIPDQRVLSSETDPAEEAVVRESVRLAFVTALQHLPPRQRAVLILREVLKWRANEVAELLDTTVVSVNSALQRARATLADRDVTSADVATVDDDQQELLARYVDAFERFDIESLVALLHEDATMSMPPYPLWLQGAGELRTWLLGPGSGCRGSRYQPIHANGMPGFAQWRAAPGGGYEAWAIHVPRISGGRFVALDFFVDKNLFPLFGLPMRLDS
jgi:RNA polymerase sigma-70 factor (ECF subfamily)